MQDGTVVGRKMPHSKMSTFESSKTVNMFFTWKGDFKNMIKLMVLTWKNFLIFRVWVQCNYESSKLKEGGEGIRVREENVMTKAEAGVMWWLIGATNQEIWSPGSGAGKEQILRCRPPEELNPASTVRGLLTPRTARG